jgi:nicotinamidase-related amidase
MKRKSFFIVCLTFFIVVFFHVYLHSEEKGDPDTKKTALLIIDIQDFYFPGGSLPLVNPEPASLNAQKILKKFREKKLLVVHVRHNAKSGAGIHDNVKPVKGEKVISKNYANSFRETDLLEYLNKHQVKRLVIVGMQTHMCVEAATRAACDLGFECILVQDACATRALTFQDKTVSAKDVHYSTLSTLSPTYAEVVDTKTFLEKFFHNKPIPPV